MQFLDQLFMPVLMPTLVEIPQVQFLDLLFMPVVVPTPVEIPQVQFSDKDVDVPVISTTRAYGGPDSVSRTRMLTCPFYARQVLMVVQTVCL